jgi:NADPH:quinone reductase
VLFKGITAQYLLKSTYPVGPGTIIVLYGVAGGVGQIMTRWAKHLGAFVIGIVSKQESVALAETLGCDAVLVFNPETLAADVAKITNGKKADVVYDPIGKVSFNASLDSLRPRGLLVSFGASSGAPPAIEVGTLNAKGSLFLTRPSIAAHTANSGQNSPTTAALQSRRTYLPRSHEEAEEKPMSSSPHEDVKGRKLRPCGLGLRPLPGAPRPLPRF